MTSEKQRAKLRAMAKEAPQCSEKDCPRPSRSMGLCWAHYMRGYRGSKVEGPLRSEHGRLTTYERPEEIHGRVSTPAAKALAAEAKRRNISLYQLASEILDAAVLPKTRKRSK